jgi:hypothetical protein
MRIVARRVGSLFDSLMNPEDEGIIAIEIWLCVNELQRVIPRKTEFFIISAVGTSTSTLYFDYFG